MVVDRRRDGSQTRPPFVDHDVRRARRLGAPYLAGFRPAGRPPLPAAAKEAKRRRGYPAVASRLQRGHPRTPGIYGSPIPGGDWSLSGAGWTTTAPASATLPLLARNQDGLVCWTKQARLIAQVLISAAVTGGRVRDPPLRGNFGHGRYDGRRSHETDSVSPHAMKGPEIAVGAALSGRPSAAEERFSCHPVGEGLAPPAGFRNFFGQRWVFALRGGAPGRRALRTLWSTKDGRLHGSAHTAFQANHRDNGRG